MAYFNEDNVTEQMCIEIAKEVGYQYCPADELREAKNDVIAEPLLQQALIKINHITLAEAQIVRPSSTSPRNLNASKPSGYGCGREGREVIGDSPSVTTMMHLTKSNMESSMRK